jgi:hypothetical protein
LRQRLLGLDQRGDRKSEVAHLHRAIRCGEAIGGFHIAVEYTGTMGGFEAIDDLKRGVDCFRDGQRTPLLHPVLERAIVEQLHGDDWRSLDFIRSQDCDDIRVPHRRGELTFPQKTRAHLGSVERLAENLQGNSASALTVLSFVHRAHAAFSEQTQYSVATEIEWLLDGPVLTQALGRRG